jgi:hypothetical protein
MVVSNVKTVDEALRGAQRPLTTSLTLSQLMGSAKGLDEGDVERPEADDPAPAAGSAV